MKFILTPTLLEPTITYVERWNLFRILPEEYVLKVKLTRIRIDEGDHSDFPREALRLNDAG